MLLSAAVQVSARNYTGTSFINDNTYVLGDVNGDGDQNGKEVKISSCSQAGAKGSAVFAAFAGACFADIASSSFL